jgi:hypothetical protein
MGVHGLLQGQFYLYLHSTVANIPALYLEDPDLNFNQETSYADRNGKKTNGDPNLLI